MNQCDVNNAVTAYLDSGDSEPWLRVLEAIRTGEVSAEPRTNTLTLAAITRPATIAFGRRLTQLRIRSGVTQQSLADMLEISRSSVTRQMNGQSLGHWPGVALMIEAMGGDPAEFKKGHAAGKGEHKQKRGQG